MKRIDYYTKMAQYLTAQFTIVDPNASPPPIRRAKRVCVLHVVRPHGANIVLSAKVRDSISTKQPGLFNISGFPSIS